MRSFVEPTIFTDCSDDMSIATDEIFGFVMSVLKFGEQDDIIQRANNTDYRLAAGVFNEEYARAKPGRSRNWKLESAASATATSRN